MYELTKRVVFCAAHSIKGAGKCANKHGHNWEATIRVVSPSLDSRGFICDVAELKQAAFKYDHDDLDKWFVNTSPSTENVAQRIAVDALKLCEEANPDGLFEIYVHLVETENNAATATAISARWHRV